MKGLTPNLMVENVQTTISFYKEIFGFEVLMTAPEKGIPFWALLKNNNVTIMLQQRKSFETEYSQMTGKPLGGTLHFFTKIEKLDDFYNKIKDKVKVIKTPHITTYKMKEFSVEDCNGYLFVFAQEL